MSRPETIDVSVVIPCYNAGEWLREAVDSARRLDGGFGVEILVVDDGSTADSTLKILESVEATGVRVFRQANAGPAAARNRGIAAARGRYIVPLDADDRLSQHFLVRTVPVLEDDAGIAVVYGRAMMFGEVEGVHPLEPYAFPEVLLDPRIYATALFRRRIWEAVGGYRETMKEGWEDFDFWLGVLERGGEVRFLDEILFEYRQSGGSRDRNLLAEKDRVLQTYRKLYEQHSALYLEHLEVFFEAHLDRREWWNLLRPVATPKLRVVLDERFGEALEGGIARSDGTVGEFRFPVDRRSVDRLRLHPYDGPCEVRIESVRLETEAGAAIELDVARDLRAVSPAVSRGGGRWMFVDLDPRLEMKPAGRIDGIVGVVVRMAITSVRARLREVMVGMTESGREAEADRHEAERLGFELEALRDLSARRAAEVEQLREQNREFRSEYLKERSLRRGLQGSDCGRTQRAILKLLQTLWKGRLPAGTVGFRIEADIDRWEMSVEDGLARLCRRDDGGAGDRTAAGWEEFRVRRFAEIAPFLPADDRDTERHADLRKIRFPAVIERLVEGERWRRIGRLFSLNCLPDRDSTG